MSNWNSKRCGCGGRRPRGCLNSIGGPHGWYGCPGYTGGCPDADDAEQNDALDAGQECPRRRRCRRAVCGIFTAALPMAVAANGVVPLNGCGADGGLSINGGLVTVETPGIYLATVTARLPEEVSLETTVSLNANDASQYSALMDLNVSGPAASCSQAIFEVCDRTTVSLRSAEAINVTATSPQPLFTLSLVRLD